MLAQDGPRRLRVLLFHDAKIMLGVLVEILCLDVLSAPCCVLRHGGVTFIVVAGILDRVAGIAWGPDSSRPLVGRAIALWSSAVIRAVIAAIWTVVLSTWTLVQSDLQC